jgi:cyclohexadienyl dehydratase
VIVAAFGTACISTGLDTIVRRGVVRVYSIGDHHPFTYRNPQGRWSGMDIEMAQDLATRLDVELNVVPTTWGTMMKNLGSRCDITMGATSPATERSTRSTASRTYVTARRPSGPNADFDKANIHHATIENYPDNNTIFGQVVNNTADVVITDSSEIRWQTDVNPQLCGESVGHPFTVVQKAYLLPQNDLAQQQRVDDRLNIAENDGTYAAISKRWMGQMISSG